MQTGDTGSVCVQRPPWELRGPSPDFLILLLRGGAWASMFQTVAADDANVQLDFRVTPRSHLRGQTLTVFLER